MLIVDPEKRFTVDQCLAHPWITQKPPGPNDSTNGLVSGLAGLEMSRRAPFRERTLLSSINEVHVERVPAGAGRPDVKVYSKNMGTPKREMRPDDNRDPNEFLQMGGRGDQGLFDNEPNRYPANDIGGKPGPVDPKSKGKAKGKKGGR
jgi:serine/threonine-protein kinase Chk2